LTTPTGAQEIRTSAGQSCESLARFARLAELLKKLPAADRSDYLQALDRATRAGVLDVLVKRILSPSRLASRAAMQSM
jgi:hypothetical protein